ncbi:MAG: formylglycine-generating enzyme family protein [Acidobacteria bacterium]|nr:MAG: formylglycine-generating enzyme family protein [Acidobacteriota bacterium]
MLVVALVIVGVVLFFMLRGSGENESTDNAATSQQANANSNKQTTPTAPAGMVYVPGGEFTMGRDNDPTGYESPAHKVTVKPFFMDTYEVTNEDFAKFLADTHNMYSTQIQYSRIVSHDTARQPVTGVTWNMAKAYADWAGKRLPTEAEWEYACRAGTTEDYAGNLDSMAWYDANSGNKTHPVGQKQANGFGLYDMHGNIWEWCEDVWHNSYNGAPTDGGAWLSSGVQEQVLRGGSWHSAAWHLRSARRSKYSPDVGSFMTGFRLVAVVRT